MLLLGNLGFNPLMGARPLNRVIQTRLQDPLAEDIIAGKIKTGDTVYVTATGDELFIGTTDTREETADSGAQKKQDENAAT